MTKAFTRTKWYPWLVVGLLWAVALLNYLDRQMLSTLADSMMVDIKELEDPRYFGMLMSGFLWVYGLMSPVAGTIADKVSRKWLIVSSLFVWSGVTMGMSYCTSFDQIYVLRLIMGISEALYIPAGLALITEFHQGPTRSLAVGIHMTGLYMGQALGGFGATVAHQYSWQAAFHTFGYIGVIYALVLAFLLYDKRSTAQQVPVSGEGREKMPSVSVWQNLGKLFRTSSFWILLFVFAVPSLPGWATKNWLPTLFSDSLNLGMEFAGPLSTITIAASSFVGVIVGGMLSDRWVSKNIRGRVYTSALGLALTIPSLILLGLGHTMPAVVGSALFFGIGFGLFDANNMPILCQFVPDRLRSTAYGFMNLMGVFAGAMITQVMGAWTGEGNLGLGFSALGGIVLIALLLEIFFLRPKYQDMKEADF